MEEPNASQCGTKSKTNDEKMWEWWKEEKNSSGDKWKSLEHKGPLFSSYKKIPQDVEFLYDSKPIRLSEEAEQVASFYAKMLDDKKYTTKKEFNDNFFEDWRNVMTEEEKEKIIDLSKCNFTYMHEYFLKQAKENKKQSEGENLKKVYGYCTMDGHKQKIDNYNIEPGLFKGRGENPKMGKFKRVKPEDVTINCSQNWTVDPPPGCKWKKVVCDPKVTWLASWNWRIGNELDKEKTYMKFHPSSKLSGEADLEKYDKVRLLHKHIDDIRKKYNEDLISEDNKIKQRAVALYFIDTLALRVGYKKGKDESDTVGCCSLRVENIQLFEQKDNKRNVVKLKFLGKQSIDYETEVSVEELIFRNLQDFVKNKQPTDDLFNLVSADDLNDYLKAQMDGLTAKVFRTYRASYTLQKQLNDLTKPEYSIKIKKMCYELANLNVAILCNHQSSSSNLKNKIKQCKESLKSALETEKTVKDAEMEELINEVENINIQNTSIEEDKNYAPSSSKEYYLDPRITVAWCKKFNVNIEEIFTKGQCEKFRWAIGLAGPDYCF